MIAVVGILDDHKGVSAVVKLGAQVLAASVAYFAGIHIDVLGLPFVGLVQLGWLSYGVTVFWFVLAINAINLIDGMDGLASSVVSLAAGTFPPRPVRRDHGLWSGLSEAQVQAARQGRGRCAERR